MDRKFPADFLFGAATSSFQIEGAAHEDGKGPSIWDDFCRIPGAVLNGDTGDVAIDHYHRYRDDVALMQQLNLQAYRFSISWPRIIPNGRGAIEKRGIDFYDCLVDELLAKNITPLATLYHWDLPSALQKSGGWANRDTAYAFAEYTNVISSALGDRVKQWATHNEPWVVAFIGNAAGIMAPGIKDPNVAFDVAHHLLLGHGLAMNELRTTVPDGKHGIVLNLAPVYIDEASVPADHPAHQAARLADGQLNRIWLDPLFKGEYAQDLLDLNYFTPGIVHAGDFDIIGAPMDWLGINYYQDIRFVPADENTIHAEVLPGVPNTTMFPGVNGLTEAPAVGEITSFGWSVTPHGLTNLLKRVTADYPTVPPMYITENGAAYDDPIIEGHIHDQRRTDYVKAHLHAALDAIEQGVDLRGYMLWSLFDNFEWAAGYGQRFGIVHVDYDTQVRTPKDTALWYARVIQAHAIID